MARQRTRSPSLSADASAFVARVLADREARIAEVETRLAEVRRERGDVEMFPTTVAADHPLAKAMGREVAQAVMDNIHRGSVASAARVARADRRRDIVVSLTLDGRSRKEIAQAAECCIEYVTKIRREMRDCGRLPLG